MNSTFKNCNNRAVLIQYAAEEPQPVEVTFVSCTFTSNTYNGSGAAVYISGSVQARFNDSIFMNNEATVGAAIFSTAGSGISGSLAFSGSTFASNRGHGVVTTYEGALASSSDSVFRNNTGGSSLYVQKLKVGGTVLSHVTWEDNSASDNSGVEGEARGRSGAAVYLANMGEAVAFLGCSFRRNAAVRQGGAVAIVSVAGRISFSECNFTSNSAAVYGGALWGQSATDVVVADDTRLTGNVAPQGGAVALELASTLEVDAAEFTSNSATYGGGISAIQGSSLVLSDSTFTYNSARFAGGVECLECTSVAITGCTFEENAGRNGSAGALALYGTSNAATISNTTFRRNSVKPNSTVSSQTCYRDSVGSGGAVCLAIQSNVDMYNVTFDGNVATSGGAMHVAKRCDVSVDSSTCTAASVRLAPSVTLTSNTALGGAGGGIYALTINTLTINCTADNGAVGSWYAEDITTWPYNTTGCPSWTGNAAPDGGYGDGIATGYTRLGVEGEAVISNFVSNDPLKPVLQLYDAFGTKMTSGSFECSATEVKIDTSTNSSLANYIVGVSSNTTSISKARFDNLKFRAPAGTYTLSFTGTPIGDSSSRTYTGAELVVSVRTCTIGEIITYPTNDMCTVCSSSTLYSFNFHNITCDSCPENALCGTQSYGSVSNTTNSTESVNSTSNSTGNWTDSFAGYLVPLDGYWHSSPFSPQIHECPLDTACTYSGRASAIGVWQGGLNVEDLMLPTPPDSKVYDVKVYWALQCSTGHVGTLCGQCDNGYGIRSSGACSKCPPKAINTTYYILSYALTIFLLILTIRSTLGRSLEVQRAELQAARKRSGGGAGGPGGGADAPPDSGGSSRRQRESAELAKAAAAAEAEALSAGSGGGEQLIPAALPGGGGAGRSHRVPRSVLAREGKLGPAAAAAGSGGAGGSDSEGEGALSDGERRVSQRHRLSRMSRGNSAEGCATVNGPQPTAEGLAPGASGFQAGAHAADDSARGDGMRQRRKDTGGWRAVEKGSAGGDDAADEGGNDGGGSGDSGPLKHMLSGGVKSAVEAKRRDAAQLVAMLKEEEATREEKPPHTVVIKILVSYLQVTAVARSLDLKYPSALQRLLDVSSQASSAVSTFVSLDCSLSSSSLPKAIQRTLINVTLPLIFTAIALPVWLITYLVSARQARKPAPEPLPSAQAEADMKPADAGGAGGAGRFQPLVFRTYMATRIVVTSITVIFYFYPSVTDEILSILTCKTVDVAGNMPYDQYTKAQGSFWESDYGIPCFGGQHAVLSAVVAFPGIVLFCVGVPLASALWLRRGARRGRLNEPLFSDRYGFLYEDYRRDYYFWESIIMLRKLATVGVVIATASYDDIVQVLSVLGVVVAAGVAQMLCRPYSTDRFNALEATSLAATSLVLYLCCFFLVDLSEAARGALSTLIVLVNAGMLAWFVIVLAVEVWRYTVRLLDTDGNGKVTPAEVRAWLTQQYSGPVAKAMSWLAVKRAAKRTVSARRTAKSWRAAASSRQTAEPVPSLQLPTPRPPQPSAPLSPVSSHTLDGLEVAQAPRTRTRGDKHTDPSTVTEAATSSFLAVLDPSDAAAHSEPRRGAAPLSTSSGSGGRRLGSLDTPATLTAASTIAGQGANSASPFSISESGLVPGSGNGDSILPVPLERVENVSAAPEPLGSLPGSPMRTSRPGLGASGSGSGAEGRIQSRVGDGDAGESGPRSSASLLLGAPVRR